MKEVVEDEVVSICLSVNRASGSEVMMGEEHGPGPLL